MIFIPTVVSKFEFSGNKIEKLTYKIDFMYKIVGIRGIESLPLSA